MGALVDLLSGVTCCQVALGLVAVLVLEYVRRYARRNAQVGAPNSPPGPPVPTNFVNPFGYDAVVLREKFAKGYSSMGESLYHKLLEDSEKYPDGVFRIYLTFTPLVILTRAESAKVLLESNSLLTKSFVYTLIHPWLGTGLLTSTGPKWRSRRKMITPTFHFEILEDFMGVLSEQSEIMSDMLQKKAGQEVDIMKYIKNSTLDIICETAMGVKIEAQTKDSDYLRAQTVVGEKFMERVLSPWQWNTLLYQLMPSGREFFSNLRVLHDFTTKVIEERMHEHITRMARGEPPLPKRKAFLDLLITEQLHNKTMELEDIREEVDTFVFEGHDTTAMGIGWCMYLVGHHAAVQAKIHEEMDMVFGADHERPIGTDDIKQMKYLEAVIKEAQRMFPSVPLIGRNLTEDTKIGNYHIPRGTDVLVLIPAVHRDPKYYHEPMRFKPERFLDDTDQEKLPKHPFAYVPFSAGPRNCIGQRFAMNEEKVMLASVFRRFACESLLPIDKVAVTAEMVTRPVNGLPMKFTVREAAN